MHEIVFSVPQVFELLISFCSLGSLRSCMCQLLFSGPVPSADQLKAVLSQPPRPDCPPLVATVCWTALPVAVSRKASLAALDFLKEMYEVSRPMGVTGWWMDVAHHVGFS